MVDKLDKTRNELISANIQRGKQSGTRFTYKRACGWLVGAHVECGQIDCGLTFKTKISGEIQPTVGNKAILLK